MPRQEKLSLFGQLRPTGIDDSGAQKLRALAGLSDQIGSEIFQRGAQIRQKQGALAGAQSVQKDEQGNVVAPKMERSTIYGEAFNQSALLAHRSQIEMDSRKRLDEIQNQFQLDPEGFEKAALGHKRGAMAGMPQEIAVAVGMDLDQSISNRRAKITNSFFNHQKEQQRATALERIETYQDDITNLTRSGDLTQQAEMLVKANEDLDALIAVGTISAIEAEKIKEDTLERVQEQTALRGVEAIVFDKSLTPEQQLEKGFDFVEKLRKSELKDLSAEKKDALINIVESKLNGVVARMRSQENQRNIEQEKVVSDLMVTADLALDKAKRGESFEFDKLTEDMEKLHNIGAIKQGQRTSIKNKLVSAQDELERITLSHKKVIAKFSDPSIVVSQSDVDSLYDLKLAPTMQDIPAQDASVYIADFATKTKVLPTAVKKQISSSILSGDPDLIRASADIVDRIDKIPGMVEQITQEDRATMQAVVDMLEIMPPEQAVLTAKQLTDPNNKARIESREKLISANKMEFGGGWRAKGYKDIVKSEFSSTFGAEPSEIAVSNMTKEYKTAFESFYKLGYSDDPKAAQKYALDNLKRNWSESEFGFMKNPPEMHYPVEGKTDYIKKQYLDEVRAGHLAEGIKEYTLISDEQTDKQAAEGNPSYKMMAITEDGAFLPVFLTGADGKPSQRWMPDAKKEQDRILLDRKTKAEKERALKIKSKAAQDISIKERRGF